MVKEQFLQKLNEEIILRQQKGLIWVDQANNIKNYYKEEYKFTWTKSNIFIQIILVIWAILLWLWVILFFASNWDYIWDMFKTVLLIGTLMITYILWFYLYYINWNYKKTWYALILLASIFYWANIFLLWQIYNIWWTFYQAMLIWLIWLIPLIYMTWFTALLVLGMILLYVFIFSFMEDFFSYVWEFSVYIIWAISLFFIWFSKIHKSEKFIRFEWIYNIVWLLWLFLSMFLLTFEDFLNSYNYWDIDNRVFYLFLWIIWLWFIMNIYNVYKNKWFDIKGDSWYYIHTFIFILLWFFYFNNDFIKQYNDYILLWTNIYMMIMILFSIYLWTLKHKVHLINIALFFFVVFMLAKYFDWFYEMIDRALFFMIWWILLMIWWWFLEMRRRKILEKID